MIYLITGVPGSGKSLYAVSTLLQSLMKQVVKGEDGQEHQRRLCVDNIPGLLLPHELMSSGKVKGQQVEPDEGHGLWNWFDWCKPGDIIVSDEVQRHWRPRGMGTKPPEDVAQLETHRHKGVDLVLITQNPMLLDQNVRRLVGRHLHVRRIFGGARALIYEWDGCQTDISRVAGATKSFWSYPKDAYKLYRSSELHTKQQHKIPLFFAFPLVVAALAVFAGPKAYDALYGSMTGKGIQTPAKPASAATAPSTPRQPLAAASAAPAVPAASAASASVAVHDADKVRPLGCIAYQGRCECFDTQGARLTLPQDVCLEGSHRVGYTVPAVAQSLSFSAALKPTSTALSATPAPIPPSTGAAVAGTYAGRP